jgi:hypothetical protein
LKKLRKISEKTFFSFPRITSKCECKLFTEMPGMHADQQTAFPASAAIRVDFVFNMFRL